MSKNSILEIKVLRDGIEIPRYQTDGASGFDVRAYECWIWDEKEKELVLLEPVDGQWVIPPLRTVLFKTGLAMACPENTEVQVRSRSGYSLKSSMRMSNALGTIDEDYRGEIGIIMDNNGFYGFWNVPVGERIAQCVVCPVIRPVIEIKEELSETIRGENGYGSTGTK